MFDARMFDARMCDALTLRHLVAEAHLFCDALAPLKRAQTLR